MFRGTAPHGPLSALTLVDGLVSRALGQGGTMFLTFQAGKAEASHIFRVSMCWSKCLPNIRLLRLSLEPLQHRFSSAYEPQGCQSIRLNQFCNIFMTLESTFLKPRYTSPISSKSSAATITPTPKMKLPESSISRSSIQYQILQP